MSITVQNDDYVQEPKQSNRSTRNPLERLQNQQSAEMKVAKEKSSKQIDLPDLKTPKIKKKDVRKRDEILLLNKQIKEKISKMKPKLISIMDQKQLTNGTVENKKAFPGQNGDLPVLKLVYFQKDKSVVVSKTKLPSDIHIQRYSFDQLYQIQQSSTWEMVPRLINLGICRTHLSPLNEFLMSLLEMTESERSEAILKKAAERKFIKLKDSKNFEYLSPQFIAQGDDNPRKVIEKPTKIDENLKKTFDHIDRFKMMAANDEELNELIYQHEFISLFENELKDYNLDNRSHEDIVKFLLDSNQAFILHGEIRVNQRNNQEAYVTHKRGMKDVCINKLILRKHAFHGDFVKVLVKKDSSMDDDLSNGGQLDDSTGTILDDTTSDNRTFGCVLDIIEKRHSRRVIGSFAPLGTISKNRNYLTVNTRDQKVPNVKVNVRNGIPKDVELSDKMLLTVEIISWAHDQPQGKIVSIIGKKGQLKTENQAILQANNLNPVPFALNIIEALPKEPFEIPSKEFEYREDLRKRLIFSIDPESARDLDDALSCEVLDNGNLEVGVHISDVSYFVSENSDLDNIVKEKATTIYMVDTVYHMLPENLCFLCSLLPGSDKLAYSVFFEMNPETADIYKTRFTRSIINSSAKLNYDHAQKVIEKKNQDWSEIQSEFPEIHNGFTVSDIADVIVRLQKIAIILRADRKSKGALKIDQPKLMFLFGKENQRMEAPIDFAKYTTKDSNRLIEEFMLLANINVAKFIHSHFPDISLLRQHDAPNENGLKKLTKVLTKHNVQLDTSSSRALSMSMENLITFAKHPNAMNAVLNHMVSKTMTRAKYFCSSTVESEEAFWHYALSTPIYTHFTSPIRRYADILVHRVLNAALKYEAAPSRTPDEVQVLANICNVQKYNAKLAGDDSSNLYFMHFIKALKSKSMLAGVVGIFEFNLEIVLVDTGHLLKVYYKVERCFLYIKIF